MARHRLENRLLGAILYFKVVLIDGGKKSAAINEKLPLRLVKSPADLYQPVLSYLLSNT